MSKPRVIKDFDKLDTVIQEQIKLEYPYGFDKYLITFKNMEGKFVSALPFETEEKHYLVRMTQAEAREIIEQDDDYGDDGVLKDEIREEYEDKYIDEELDLGEEVMDDDDMDDLVDDDDDDDGGGGDDED
jgi:hypothetical protein